VVVEGLHKEAFRGQGLGLPLHCPSYNVSNIDEINLKNHVKKHYVPERAVLVGLNVDHDVLTHLTEEIYHPSGVTVQETATQYVGGEARSSSTDDTHIAVAFNGASKNSVDYPALAVLQKILGSGSALSSAGPAQLGSRLNLNVVEKNPFVAQAAAFNFAYSDAGLFGIYVSGKRSNSAKLLELIRSEFSNLSSITDGELAAGKKQAVSSLLFGLEHNGTLVNYLGTRLLQQLPTTTTKQATSDTVAAIEKVTSADVKRVVTNLLSSKPTVSAVGDVFYLPSFKI